MQESKEMVEMFEDSTKEFLVFITNTANVYFCKVGHIIRKTLPKENFFLLVII